MRHTVNILKKLNFPLYHSFGVTLQLAPRATSSGLTLFSHTPVCPPPPGSGRKKQKRHPGKKGGGGKSWQKNLPEFVKFSWENEKKENSRHLFNVPVHSPFLFLQGQQLLFLTFVLLQHFTFRTIKRKQVLLQQRK